MTDSDSQLGGDEGITRRMEDALVLPPPQEVKPKRRLPPEVTAPYARVRVLGLGKPNPNHSDDYDDFPMTFNGYTGVVLPDHRHGDDKVKVGELCRREDDGEEEFYEIPFHKGYLRLVCAWCEEGQDRKFRHCNNCGMSYCNRDHQERDWQSHKDMCPAIALARAEWYEPRPPPPEEAPVVDDDIVGASGDADVGLEEGISVLIRNKARRLMDADKFDEAEALLTTAAEVASSFETAVEETDRAGGLRTKALDLIRGDDKVVEDALDLLTEAETLFRKAGRVIDEIHCMYEYSVAVGLLGRDDESLAAASVVHARASAGWAVEAAKKDFAEVDLDALGSTRCLITAARFQVLTRRSSIPLCSRREISSTGRMDRFEKRAAWTDDERTEFNTELNAVAKDMPTIFSRTDALKDVAIRVLLGIVQSHWDPAWAVHYAKYSNLHLMAMAGTIAHAETLLDLGLALADTTDVVQARKSLEHAAAMFRISAAPKSLFVLALRKLGGFLRDVGDLKGAKRALREARDVLVKDKKTPEVLDDVKKDLSALRSFERDESRDRCLRYSVGDQVFVNKTTFVAIEEEGGYDISDNRDDLGIPVRRGLVVALWPAITDTLEDKVYEPAYEVVLDDTAAGASVFEDLPRHIFRYLPEDPQHQQPRFPVGTRVLANCGEDHGRLPGTVIQVFHASWNNAENESYPYIAPYQIRLDDGSLICAPTDSDGTVRALQGSKPGRRRHHRPR